MWVTTTGGLFSVLFLVLWLFRYFRLLVNIAAFFRFSGRFAPKNPRYTARDVTFLMPTTFSDPEEVIKCLLGIQKCGPAAIIIVTSLALQDRVKARCANAGVVNVQVFGVSRLNKRRQMLVGLAHVKTDITFFIDDDVYYPSSNLPQHLLNCFEDDSVGAAGPRQRARRDPIPSVWNFLGICYLERRNFNTGATNCIDGGISTLSGRTQAVRTAILKNKEFYHYFRNDSFLGRKLTVDDDKALTRFIYSRGWNISLNFHEECTIETTFEEGFGFINQCLRWARGHWRGNLIVMAKEKYWYNTHVWTLYSIYISQFQTPALLVDGLLFWLLHKSIACYGAAIQSQVITAFATWIAFTKIVKIVPHFVRYPQDVIFIPVSILFSYLHGFINVYALFTTHKTIWGSRGATADQAVPEDSFVPADIPENALRPEVLARANDKAIQDDILDLFDE
ncbi:Chitin synthase 3 [Sphaceloma murrayae]|uniref:Chitin synthase 3 n=1 Tax=Sphaceloma murrayae TaxID=2082308 RepID=A0A2K1QW98_9PEZI|nr:Chitin synthase 3 [Sphaceloma murrayae]